MCSRTPSWIPCSARSRSVTSASTFRIPTRATRARTASRWLRHVAALVRESGWQLGNLDATVLAQAPKLAPHILQMRENLAAAIGCAVEQVSVKATTEEGLGFTGSKQGIAAHCVCLLERI